MFHWICPECGREIAPTVRECAACDPKAIVAEPALVGVVEAPPARTEAVEAPSVHEAVLPELSAGHPPQDLGGPFDWNEGPEDEQLEPPPSEAKFIEPPRSERRFRLTDPAPAIPPSLHAWISALGPAPEVPRSPVAGSSHAKPVAEPPAVRTKITLPSITVRNGPASPVPQVEEPPASVPLPASRLEEPATPYAGPAPALAPLANYSPLAGRPMRPAVPTREVFKRDFGPRTTLPGPMLTPGLVKFRDRELNLMVPKRHSVRKRLIPSWAVAVLILGTVLVAGFNSVFSIVPRSESEAKASSTVTVPLTPAPAPPASSNTLSKAIEVTGFRIEMDPAKKPEIQYLVVNHTATPFSGVTVYVTLHTVHETPGQPPIGHFQFRAPDLKPYESKEMASAIERVNRPADLPDWQDLRAEVEVGQ